MKYYCLFLCAFVQAACCTGGLGEVKVTQVVAPLLHSEGPHWDEEKGVLYYVDIEQQLVNRYDPASGTYTAIKLDGGPVSLVVPVKGSDQQLVATRGLDIVTFSWNGLNSTISPEMRILASVDRDKPENRFNDGKADASGRLWAGTMGPEPTVGNVELYQGKLYSLGPGETVAVPHVWNESVSNGLAWNSENTIFYWIDTPTLQVSAFSFNLSSAQIDDRHTVFDLSKYGLEGLPDGMTIDHNGNLWVACFGCGKVLHVDPRSQRLIGCVDIPASRVTSVMFGGAGLDTLFVTTSRVGLSSEQLQQEPLAGSVFAVTGLGVSALAPANKVVLAE